jgi:hypothetical protein
MVWLSADWETPSFAAAFVKLRSRPHGQKGHEIIQIDALHS